LITASIKLTGSSRAQPRLNLHSTVVVYLLYLTLFLEAAVNVPASFSKPPSLQQTSGLVRNNHLFMQLEASE